MKQILFFCLISISFLASCVTTRDGFSAGEVRLKKNSHTLTIYGTLHRASERIYRDFNWVSNSFVSDIEKAEYIFFETVLLEDYDYNRIFSYQFGSDEKATMNEYIQNLSPDRRDNLIRNLNDFPNLNNRQDLLLQLRPYAALLFLYSPVMSAYSILDSKYSIDDLYMDYIQGVGQEILPLETPETLFANYNQLEQNGFLLEFEAIVNSKPNESLLREAYDEKEHLYYTSIMNNNFANFTDQGILLDALGIKK
jgi:uncharacterized protein YbaP (TraB family)